MLTFKRSVRFRRAKCSDLSLFSLSRSPRTGPSGLAGCAKPRVATEHVAAVALPLVRAIAVLKKQAMTLAIRVSDGTDGRRKAVLVTRQAEKCN